MPEKYRLNELAQYEKYQNRGFFMLNQALKRLFLILFLVLLGFNLFFIHSAFYEKNYRQDSLQYKRILKNTLPCPLYMGLSFVPKKRSPHDFLKSERAFKNRNRANTLIFEENFAQTLTNFKKTLQKEQLPLNRILFAFPLVLTKDNIWLVSEKTFLISPQGKRSELSHLTYSEIKEQIKNFSTKTQTPLKWNSLISYLPKNAKILIYLRGSNEKKIIKNLDGQIKRKNTKREIYISSSNEKLLLEILAEDMPFKILHSFKTLVRAEILLPFKNSLKHIPGQGVVIPSRFSLSLQSLKFLKNKNKLLFLEKEAPYSTNLLVFMKNIYALISSDPHSMIQFMRSNKEVCFTKNLNSLAEPL